MSETETAVKPLRRSTPRWEWLLFVVFGLVALVVFALPPTIQWAATDWLRKQGADEVRIEDVRINLFRGQAALVGVYVRDGDHAPLEVGQAGLTFSWRSLFKRRAEVTDVSLNGATVPVVLEESGRLRVGILLPQPGEKQPEEEDAEEPDGEPWGFALRSVRIDDSELSLQIPEFSGTWRVQHLALTDLVSWLPGDQASLHLDSRLNGSALHLEAQLQPFSDPLRVQASVQLESFDLGQLAPLAGDALQALAGDLRTNMKLQLEHSGGVLRLQPEGSFQLVKVRVTDPAGRQVAADVDWDGSADVKLREGVPAMDVSGALGVSGLRLSDPSGQQLSGALDWQGKVDVKFEDGDPTVGVDGRLRLADAALRDTVQQRVLQVPGLQWHGRVGVRVRGGDPAVDANGKLQVSNASLEEAVQQLALQLPELQWQGDVGYGGRDGGQEVRLKGRLAASKLDVRSGDQSARLAALEWQAQGNVGLPKEGPMQIVFSGPLALNGLQLEAPAHRIDLASVAWDGAGDITLGDQLLPKASGSLQTGAFSLLQKTAELRLARFERLQVDDIQVDGLERQSIASVQLTDLHALKSVGKKRPEVVRLARLQTGPVKREAGRVDVGLVTLDGVVADLLRRSDGSIAALADVQAAPAAPADEASPATEAPAAESEASEPMRIVAAGLRVTGDSRLRFLDRQVKPRFRTEYIIEKLELGALDTGAPATETPLEVVLKTPGEGRLTLKGGGRFLQDPPSAKLVLTGRALELASLSPYTIQTIGYEFGSGQLNLDTDVKVDAGKIVGENKIHLRRFTMEKANASAAEKLAANLTMSLESALSLLRDSEGDIKLKIPLRGDLANPEVDVQDAINKALGKAVRKAALSYLKYTLQPYGSLITVVEVLGAAGEKLTAVKLAPVEFPAGSVQPDATGLAYLDKVAGMLKQKPDLTVKLCGIATAADRAALAGTAQPGGSATAAPADDKTPAESGADDTAPDSLREIAEARSLEVKRLLVSEKGVNASQLFLCAPRVHEGDKEKPSVEMQV